MWYSKEEGHDLPKGYLTITEIKEGDVLYIKSKPFFLQGDGMGFYSSLASAKSAARRYYGKGIKWIKEEKQNDTN